VLRAAEGQRAQKEDQQKADDGTPKELPTPVSQRTAVVGRETQHAIGGFWEVKDVENECDFTLFKAPQLQR
jgi:hypothetical protein